MLKMFLAPLFNVGELCCLYGKLARVDDFEPYPDGTDDFVTVTTLYEGRRWDVMASHLEKLENNRAMIRFR
jgi:hypothetical protein